MLTTNICILPNCPQKFEGKCGSQLTLHCKSNNNVVDPIKANSMLGIYQGVVTPKDNTLWVFDCIQKLGNQVFVFYKNDYYFHFSNAKILTK